MPDKTNLKCVLLLIKLLVKETFWSPTNKHVNKDLKKKVQQSIHEKVKKISQQHYVQKSLRFEGKT